MRKRLNETEAAQAVALYASGLSAQQVADRVGCSTRPIHRIVREAGISRGRIQANHGQHLQRPVIGTHTGVVQRFAGVREAARQTGINRNVIYRQAAGITKKIRPFDWNFRYQFPEVGE